MKRMMMLLAVVSLVSSMSVAAVVWQNDCTTLAGFGEGSNASNEAGDATGGVRAVVYDVSLFQMNSWWDNAGWTGIWTNTGVTIQNDADYTLTLRMISWADEPAGVGKPVYVNMQNAGVNPWTVIYEENVMPTFNAWSDVSISFSTKNGANAGAVGGQIAINITPNWWNNMGIDSMTINEVPEPATLALLGLGTLAALRRKK